MESGIVWNKRKNVENRKLNMYSLQWSHTRSWPLDGIIQNMYLNACWDSFEEFGQDLKGESIPASIPPARGVSTNNSLPSLSWEILL